MSSASTRGYAVSLRSDEDGGWVAEVAELPGCLAVGDSPDEAVLLVADAIEAWVEAARANGRPVPAPAPVDDDYSGRFVLRVPRTLHRRLTQEARREQMSLNAYCMFVLAQSVGLAEGLRRAEVQAPAPAPAATRGHAGVAPGGAEVWFAPRAGFPKYAGVNPRHVRRTPSPTIVQQVN